MKRLPLLLLSGLVAVAFAACGGKQPETTPTPTGPNADSLRAAQQARDDSESSRACWAARSESALGPVGVGVVSGCFPPHAANATATRPLSRSKGRRFIGSGPLRFQGVDDAVSGNRGDQAGKRAPLFCSSGRM